MRSNLSRTLSPCGLELRRGAGFREGHGPRARLRLALLDVKRQHHVRDRNAVSRTPIAVLLSERGAIEVARDSPVVLGPVKRDVRSRDTQLRPIGIDQWMEPMLPGQLVIEQLFGRLHLPHRTVPDVTLEVALVR